MSMKTSTRQVDGVTIVDCSGRITLGEGSVILRDTVRDLLSKGNKKILLNLGDVNYIDSSGIGELVSAYTTVKNQGGELKLLNLTKKVHDLLQITKLYTVFDVKDDEAAAVKSFSKYVQRPRLSRRDRCLPPASFACPIPDSANRPPRISPSGRHPALARSLQ